MTDDSSSTRGPPVRILLDRTAPGLPSVGSIPWSLTGAYLAMGQPVATDDGAELTVQLVSFASDRRVDYHGGRISIAGDGLWRSVASPRHGVVECAQAIRAGQQILINVPSYGIIALSADLALAATPQRVKTGQRSLLGAARSAAGVVRYIHATASRSELICRLATDAEPLRIRLDGSAWPVGQLGVAGKYLVITTLPEVGEEAGQLGVTSLETAAPQFSWFPLELAATHQLLDVRCLEPLLYLWISETRPGSPSGRVRLWSIDLRERTVTCVASHSLDACGPFSLERMGADPLYLYGIGRAGSAQRGTALARLDLKTGASEVAASDFGSWLGSPAVAMEHGPGSAACRSWLLVPVYDAVVDRTELTIREGRDLARAPVAFVHLPPGFALRAHGIWL